MIIRTQAAFRAVPKPNFCFICGEHLLNGQPTNREHCPPVKLFAPAHRENYAPVLRVHQACNSTWQMRDDQLHVLFSAINGTRRIDQPLHQQKLTIEAIGPEEHGLLLVSDIPLRPLVHRITRFAHALFYGMWIPHATRNLIFIPMLEADSDGTRRDGQRDAARAFAKALCTAQKASIHDELVAYAGEFRYVCTWARSDNGTPFCIFGLDIYRIASLGMDIADDGPTCIVGAYVTRLPDFATMCPAETEDHERHEIAYPLLEVPK